MVRKEVGYRVSKIGLAEVDRVIQGSIFTGGGMQLPFNREPDLPNVDTQFRKCQRRRTISYSTSTVSTEKSTVEDRISGLPDEILEFIISLLTMREGAAASILSRRWRNLFNTSMSCYNFDLFNMTGCNYLAHFDTNDELLSRLRNDKTFLRDIRKCFTGWVDRVLERRRASKMNALRVSFVLGKESAFHINRWIKYAANQGLTQLELDFEFFYIDYSCSTAYEFPFQFFGSLNYLRLNFCNFNYPPDFKGFNSLVSLTLLECFLTKDCLQNMLSNCSSLQYLSLRYCKFHGFLRKLKFSGSSLPLKHLLLHMSIPDEIMKIKVHDINLISLEFHGCDTKLSIKNTPRLARLVLRTSPGTPVDIQSNIPCLETLFFSASYWVKEIVLPKFHVFSNLKRLVFSANIVTAICLLRACPLLQKLELNMSNLGPVLTENLTHETPHNNLKKLGIYGFQDHPEKIEVIKYLLRNAVVLEKMKIFLITKTYVGNGEWILREGTVKHTEMSMEKVSQLLQNEMRPSTKLIFRPHK